MENENTIKIGGETMKENETDNNKSDNKKEKENDRKDMNIMAGNFLECMREGMQDVINKIMGTVLR